MLHTVPCTHSHTTCKVTRTEANCSLPQWAALLRCMPCDAHSAYLLYTAQWTSNTHTHSLRLNSHLTRSINSVFQFHNAPEKRKQSNSELRGQRWRTGGFFWGWGSKVTSTRDSQNGLSILLEEHVPSFPYYPRHPMSTHTSPFMKEGDLLTQTCTKTDKRATLLAVCCWTKL